MMNKRTTVWALCGAVLALAGCGEKTAGAAKKSDVPAYEGSTGPSAFAASGWKAGDRTAWEQQLRQRAQSQNEYTRTPTQP